MKRFLTICAAVSLGLMSAFAGSKTVFTTSLTRDVNKTVDQTTRLQVNMDVVCETFNRKDYEAFKTALSAGTIKVLARQGATGKTYSTPSFGTYGFWYTAKGLGTTATNTARRVACKYEDGFLKLAHYNAKVVEGDQYSVGIMFVQSADTVQYEFNVTIGTADKIVSTDQPAYEKEIKGRPDKQDSWLVKPSVTAGEGEPQAQNYVQVMAGESFTLDCVIPKDCTNGRFTWKYRGGKANGGRDLQSLKANSAWTVENATPDDAGYYVLSGRYTKDGVTTSFKDCYYYVDVQTEPLGTPFSWKGRAPQFSHDFKSDPTYNYGVYTKPEKVHTIKKKNGTAANQYVGEWWSAHWGDDLNSVVGGQEKAMEAAENMIKKYDDDFSYIRDHMGWPPDLSARDGYKSFVYIFGSGLSNDNTSKDEQGGYQGNTYVDGKNYACVWASYYPFSRFRSDADKLWSDGDYQREAMIHEGIHAIFADIVPRSFKSAWFHEAGNTWLQSAMNTERYNRYGEPGFLDDCPFIAPFMPIECYSGWLQDGSFGGPTAEGVDMYSGGKQICTWRNHLGGNQYGNAFPIILGEICGKGSIPWIWANCKDYVLKSIGSLIGEEPMRQLIMEYRARMATFDIGGWKPGYRKVANSNMGVTIGPEWEPYWIKCDPFKLTMYQTLRQNSSDYWMAPDTITNPGWSGANIIPIHVDSKAGTATVEFRPEDTEMRAQLCYVTKSGTNYYSQPVQCGKMQIDITDRPANNVIFLVVCNTDYIYSNANNEAQRKKHYDYRVRFGAGALAVADPYVKWSYNEQTLTDKSFDENSAREDNERQQEELTAIGDIASAPACVPGGKAVRLMTGNCMAGHPVSVQLADGIVPADVRVNILGLSGIVADEAPLSATGSATGSYLLPADLRPGVYFIKFTTHQGTCDTYKVFVK